MPNEIAARIEDPVWADACLLIEAGRENPFIGIVRGRACDVISYVDLIWSVT